MSDNLYHEVRREQTLFRAWRVVFQNGITSKSKSTRDQVLEFDQKHITELRKIAVQLRNKKYKFSAATGIAKQKPGKKSKRPIVIAEVRDRIVQRAILDVLQSYPPIKKYINIKTSFGGIQNLGVRDAIEAVYNAIQSGSNYYIKSDIKSFFTQIPKNKVVSIVSTLTGDQDFLALFSSAISVELKNLESLGADSTLFPIYDIGVAQGSCLSPLIGNLLLRKFDEEMNQGDIVCIRYIDDFILLGPNEKAINAAFNRALKILDEDDLSAYDPLTEKEKAGKGSTSKMFGMLGCDIRPGMIKPNRKAKSRLLNSIREILDESASLMSSPEQLVTFRKSVIETLNTISNIKKGWGNQYSFCNDQHEMKQLDRQVDKLVNEYFSKYKTHKEKLRGQREAQSRLLGIHVLTDSKQDPIVKS